MSYKTILAYLPSPETADRLLDTALPFVREHDAHFIGLHVIPRPPVMFGVMAAEMPAAIIAQQEEILAQHADRLKEQFLTRCKKADVKGEWRCNKVHYDDLVTDVVGQSLCADLILVGQEQSSTTARDLDVPARIVMEAGRPVLVIPYTGTFRSIGQHVIIAWNGTREAARAAFDALPLMRNAKSIRVLAIDPDSKSEYDSIALGDELALSLARHDLKAEVTVTKRGGGVSVADELLNQVANDGCDLLVMGCYGHSRLREALFGGVTVNLLEHMTAPVLMAH